MANAKQRAQQLAEENKLFREQLELLKQEENVFGSISGMISGNLDDLQKGDDVKKSSLSYARSLRSISDQLLANDKEGGALSEKELTRLAVKAKKDLEILKSKTEYASLTVKEQAAYDDIIRKSEVLVKLAEERLKKEQAIGSAGGVLANSLKGIEGLLKKAGFGDLASKLNLKGAIRDATEFKKTSDGTEKAIINNAKAFKNIGQLI
jgi:hypothetical protein